MIRILLAVVLAVMTLAPFARADSLTVTTVTRPPFSLVEQGADTGFSMDLLQALAESLGWEYQIKRMDSFSGMLETIETGKADLAIANISITSARETEMDFSQPIFESGLQIMVPANYEDDWLLFRALFSKDLMIAIGAAFVILMGGGMLMWSFERRVQPYFDRPAKEAWFPSFWWALNVVVNGGFEERMPRSHFGRLFGVVLVFSSLFIVSVFVAKITTVMTVDAISGSVNSVKDLYGRQVGTIANSTAAGFMDRREIDYKSFNGLNELITAFESDELEAVVFDAPILSYYAANESGGSAKIVGPIFLRENYGIAFPSGSPRVEDVNQALLALREDGTYDSIYRTWFGTRN